MLARCGWALSGALALIAILALARALEAGPLDPPGPVGSTMRQLDELVPAWDQKLTAVSTDPCDSQRFECVLPDILHPGGAGVLDRETGLVWERVPSTGTTDWAGARDHCRSLAFVGRFGWRMPATDELTSLLGADDPGPFSIGDVGAPFWTTGTYAPADPGDYAAVSFAGAGSVTLNGGGLRDRIWCVRGGTVHDAS